VGVVEGTVYKAAKRGEVRGGEEGRRSMEFDGAMH